MARGSGDVLKRSPQLLFGAPEALRKLRSPRRESSARTTEGHEEHIPPNVSFAPVVLAEPVGKKRSFARGLLLTIATFGVYAIYWNYKAHNEVYRQFELEHERRDEGMVWYVLGLIIPPLLVAYLWVFSSNVTYVRGRIGLRSHWTPGRFVAAVGIAVGLLTGALIALTAAASALPEDAAEGQVSAAVEGALPLALTLVGAALLLAAVAYAGLQRDVNELWDAYAARVTYLRGALVAPLPERIDALRLREPRLRALPRLEVLMLTDPAAATALAYDLEQALDERRRLMAVREAPEARERLELLDAALLAPAPEPQARDGDGERPADERLEARAEGEPVDDERVDGDGDAERPSGGDVVEEGQKERS